MYELHTVPFVPNLFDVKQSDIQQFDLQLFAEGGAAATGAEGAGTGAPAAEAAQPKPAGKYRGVSHYGAQAAKPVAEVAPKEEKQPEVAPEAVPEKEAEPVQVDPEAEFDKLAKGQYKDQFQKRVDAIINKRFGEVKTLQESNTALNALAAKVAARYGVDPTKLQDVESAFDADDAHLQAAAEKAGMSVEALRIQESQRQENFRLQQEAAALRQQAKDAAERQKANDDVARWMSQEAEARKIYPDLSVKAEWNNPDPQKRAQFRGMLDAGFDVPTAYKSVHHDELVAKAAQEAEKQTKVKVASDIQARGARPLENGTSGQTATLPAFDASVLTDADHRDMRRRAMAGERFTPEEYYNTHKRR
jgi:hypothetical protein